MIKNCILINSTHKDYANRSEIAAIKMIKGGENILQNFYSVCLAFKKGSLQIMSITNIASGYEVCPIPK
jgi:hypothetical protein